MIALPGETIRLIAWKLGLTARPEDVSRAAEVIVFTLAAAHRKSATLFPHY